MSRAKSAKPSDRSATAAKRSPSHSIPLSQARTFGGRKRTDADAIVRVMDKTEELRRIAQQMLLALDPPKAEPLPTACDRYESERLTTPPYSPKTIEWRRLGLRRIRSWDQYSQRSVQGSFRDLGNHLYANHPKSSAGLACKTAVCVLSAAVSWGWRDKDDDHELRDFARMQYTPNERFLLLDELTRWATALHDLRGSPRWQAGSSCDALMAVALTGARVSGVASWRWDDVAPDLTSIRMVSKGREHRQQVGQELASMLARRAPMKRWSQWVFPGRFGGKHVTREAVLGAMHRACDLAKVERATVHCLRHSWTTHAIKTGIPAKVVQQALGHSSEHMQSYYLHLVSGDVREAQDKYTRLWTPQEVGE